MATPSWLSQGFKQQVANKVVNLASKGLQSGSVNLGSVQNSIDDITKVSNAVSAKNLDYAQQQQDWSANQAAIANNFNAAEAAKNRNWQEYMSNTAHQREVADLKKAGLNPVLSAMGGNGAAVTSGAAASANLPSGSSATASDPTSALVGILSSMLSAQTSIANTAVSARAQEAVADKYTAMSRLTAQIAAHASMRNADVAAETSRYGYDKGYTASMYGAAQSAKAAMYGADTQYRIQQDFPQSMVRILDSMLSGTGYGWNDVGGQIMKTAFDVYDKWEQDNPTFWEQLAGKLKEGYASAKNWLALQKRKKEVAETKSGFGRKF